MLAAHPPPVADDDVAHGSDGPASPPGRRRARLALTAAVGMLVVGTVAWNWPTHRTAVLPGSVLDLERRVTIGDGATTTPIDGAFDGLTVRLRALDVGDLVVHAVTRDPSTIVADDSIRPPQVDSGTYHAIEKAAFVDGGQIAAAVAERALGDRVTVSSDGVEVFQIAAGSAADGVLAVGDRIIAIDGSTITDSAGLADAIAAADGGSVELTVVHGGATSTVSITPRAATGSDHAVLGVVVGTADPKITLQVPVTVDAAGVEGPSAGLMTALTVYDELAPENLAAGRTIAGTGTISLDGTVGDIGGIEAKARAAAAAGADLFLAPADQAADARRVLGARIQVVGVSSFAEALAALRSGGTPTA